MKSSAHIKGHPIHPILVMFPIAFFIGAFVFDIIGLAHERYSGTAVYLIIAGLIGGVLAAIPGLIDYNATVPPHSTAKKRAATHGLVNTFVMLLFAVALAYRLKAEDPSIVVILALEVVGVVFLCYAGWMGGTLIYRNQIGVDPRYAGAGKWKEEYLKEENGRVVVQSVDTLKKDQMRLIHVGKKRIVVANTGDQYVAFDDRCSHKGASLAGGAMICNTVQCPWHGSQFDVNNGSVKAGPAKELIRTFKVQLDGSSLIVDTSQSG
jgi:uncharacterized membrane protein/nitrite reductase/ring-hydroxylating ferredoxin subunit